ncbi:hypothetical protein [Halobacillus sp. KGW1]|nr:hypothetical protein [Halobacillus sp. KGW1]
MQKEPFNDAVEHQQKIEGSPAPGDRTIPLPIRIIGYVLLGALH